MTASTLLRDNLDDKSKSEADRRSQVLPAGGQDPDRFDWQEVWYPVFYIEDLDKTKPAKFTLLERDLVIWWDRHTNSWKAFDDRCPHRLVPLSEGRIAEDGLLECPYHGWAFKGDGNCDRIPQQPEGGLAHTSKRACVKSLPTAERQGLLFIYAGKPENAPHVKIPIIEPLETETEKWTLFGTFRDLPYDAITLLENVLDASHLPFTHHKSVGNRANAAPMVLEVLESDKYGFTGTWEEGPRRGKLGKQDTTFIAPSLMWHDLTSKQFGRTITAVYATPTRKGECRLFARFPFQFNSAIPRFFIGITPRWYSHIGQNGILEDDQIFLHYQERYLAQALAQPEIDGNYAKAFYLATAADTYVSELRKWVNRYEADPFVDQRLAAPLAKEVLLDRYHSHTSKCASCSQALRNVRKIKMISMVLAAIAWTATPLLSYIFAPANLTLILLGSGTAAIAIAVWVICNNLERKFIYGQETPLRNL
ncbi:MULTISPECIES: Rieske 2Fe-2S domain-containing protein [Pseudanabaena]|uniref:aromatic ring-hydroxylating dioxygenase subunit alpha n=1 Tax=Pseudanabaena TaxID=1152 RepID=UPI00247859E1|nr:MULTISPECIES: Rieske 2Fe-2S domain-containing protein [Pseudanabaena]MEA5489774.1 Rieske 2Fe-2S domain-containing protein [Pseudanabaena sp. CCNP1317]WGS71092.1 Rieske 2Fe-2S domain-containing protein [Pseudanabaena galeata CCNP1313]